MAGRLKIKLWRKFDFSSGQWKLNDSRTTVNERTKARAHLTDQFPDIAASCLHKSESEWILDFSPLTTCTKNKQILHEELT